MGNNNNYRAASVVNGAVSALMPMIILLAAYAVAGIYPFGNSFLLSEQNSDWYARLAQYHSALNGTGGMLYSFSEGLGGDFFSLLTGGFANPFWLIIAIYPKSALVGAVPLAMMVQSAAAGLFSYCLLERLCGEERFAAVAFSVAYAGGSVMMLGFFAPQFTGAAVFLPLVGAGVLSLCKHGSILLLFFSSLFFLFSASRMWSCLLLFTVVFYIWGTIVFGKREETATRTALLIVSTGLVFAAAAVVLIPPLLTGVGNGQTFTSVKEVDVASVGAIASSLFPGSFISDGAAPLIYCSSITLLLLPLYFFNSSLGIGERQVSGFFMLFILISMALPALSWIWLCSAEPTGVVMGYSAVFGVMAVAAAARSLSQMPGGNVRLVLLSWLIVSVLLAISIVLRWGKAPVEHMIFVAAALTLFAALSLVALSGKKITIGFCVILMLCVSCECILSGIFAINRADDTLHLMTAEEYGAYERQVRWIDGTVESNEAGAASPFFRIRGGSSETLNVASTDGMSTPQADSLMDAVGIHGGKGYTPFTDALFGVKYIVTNGSAEYIYPLIGANENGGAIYMNSAAMTVGMMTHYNVAAHTNFSANPFEAQNEIATAIAGTERRLFNNADILGRIGIGASFNETMSGTEITRYEEQAYIRYTVTAPSDGMLYMYIGCDDMIEEAALVGGRNMQLTLGVINQLGFFSRGDIVEITLTMSAERLALEGVYFASLDSVLCSAALVELSSNQMTYVAVSDGIVRGTVNCLNGQVLLTTIPYQTGWQAAVDGNPVQITNAFGSLIAVPVPTGPHSVEIWYEPPYFKVSVVISLIAFTLGLIYSGVVELIKRNREDDEAERLAQEELAEREYEYAEEAMYAAEAAYEAAYMYPEEYVPEAYPAEEYPPEVYAHNVYPPEQSFGPMEPIYPESAAYTPEPMYHEQGDAYAGYDAYFPQNDGYGYPEPMAQPRSDEYSGFVVYSPDDEGEL